MVTDPKGRSVLVLGSLDGRGDALLNIYAANVDQSAFLISLAPLISLMVPYWRVVGGDFNCVEVLSLDQSHSPFHGAPTGRLAEAAKSWTGQWDLIDCWRARHPEARVYSYRSGLHDLKVRLGRLYMCRALHD